MKLRWRCWLDKVQLLGTTSIPEHRWLGPSWDQRARGLGGTLAIPISTGGEENLLCWRNRDRYPNEDIFLHEFSHGIQVLNWYLLFLQFFNTKTLCINALRFGLKFFFDVSFRLWIVVQIPWLVTVNLIILQYFL